MIEPFLLQETEKDLAYLIQRFQHPDPHIRVITLKTQLQQPGRDPRLLPYLDLLLDDRRITTITIPFSYGEVYCLAFALLVDLRTLLQEDRPMRLANVVSSITGREPMRIMRDAGLEGLLGPSSPDLIAYMEQHGYLVPQGAREGVDRTAARIAYLRDHGYLPVRTFTWSLAEGWQTEHHPPRIAVPPRRVLRPPS